MLASQTWHVTKYDTLEKLKFKNLRHDFEHSRAYLNNSF